ncbi:hypothetical protein E7Z57_10075 [Ralstonia pseudosolanacearum]|uniref:Uncharacterized protein n=2 Tax=Ralstonia solanacearum species complex TaxID=3116862 RepID=A0A0S4TZU6_RALSL|nr:hypothetical protein E7Z57_10075 [Ralstonia pseudosolanacearum]CUV15167.1 conserved protein of unknown function [Ralstonia solanacearum]
MRLLRRAPFCKLHECEAQQGLPDFCAEFYEDTQMQHKLNFQIAIWFFIMRNIAAVQNKSRFSLQCNIRTAATRAPPAVSPSDRPIECRYT